MPGELPVTAASLSFLPCFSQLPASPLLFFFFVFLLSFPLHFSPSAVLAHQEFPLSEFMQGTEAKEMDGSLLDMKDGVASPGFPKKEASGRKAEEAEEAASCASPQPQSTQVARPSALKKKPKTAESQEPQEFQESQECSDECRGVAQVQVHGGSSSSKAASSSDALAVITKEEKRAPTVQAQAVPKWIYRKGSCLFVDLGGRRIKDSAAMTVAKFVRAALEKVRGARVGGVASLDLCLLLAGNRLSRRGLEAFLSAAKETGHHVSCLDVERNRLDPDAMQWLAEWLTRQRKGPPQKILLSHNRSIGDSAVKSFLQLLGRSRSGRDLPLWVEARFVGIKDVEAVLDELSVDISLCMALDTDACGPDRCASHAAGEPGSHLHLPGILDQHINADLVFPTQPNPQAQQAREAQEAQEAREARGESQAKQCAQGAQRQVPSDPGNPGRRGHRGQGARLPEPQKAIGEGSDASQAEESLESLEKERAQRKAWANSLGKSVVAEFPTQDLPAPAPSCGLWDLVRAEQRKKRRMG